MAHLGSYNDVPTHLIGFSEQVPQAHEGFHRGTTARCASIKTAPLISSLRRHCCTKARIFDEKFSESVGALLRNLMV
jgi:hypothetical protein